MKVNQISLIVGGEAGSGINRSGFLLAKTFVRRGFYVFGSINYQSLIRGGHNFYSIKLSSKKIYSQSNKINLLLALNKESILIHKDNIVSGGGIIYDNDEILLEKDDLPGNDIKIYGIPLKKMINELKLESITKNVAALGAVMALLNFDIIYLDKVISDNFKINLAKMNIKAAKGGYNYVLDHYKNTFLFNFEKTMLKRKEKIFLTGHEATGLAAINSKCSFYAAYPMTPSTGLLQFMIDNMKKYKIMVMQTESEIAAINMIIGASYTGVRSMTATSGGGFCLMSEGLGMAGITETPIVIMVAQRPGPSTGLPTYSSQGDLRFIIHASHGEFPRVVVAPGDVDECFYKTMESFNLAEKFQIPVIILTDKYLMESHETTEVFDVNKIKIDHGSLVTGDRYKSKDEYKRHLFTDNGISPRAIPGMLNVNVRTNADEHDEFGYTTEDPYLTTKMNDKRFNKKDEILKELKKYNRIKVYGSNQAKITIVSWGSTKGPILEAIKNLSPQIKINYLQIIYLFPFPTNEVQKILNSTQRIIVVENNKTSQLSSLLQEYCLIKINHKILKYDGRPFNPTDLSEKIKEAIKN